MTGTFRLLFIVLGSFLPVAWAAASVTEPMVHSHDVVVTRTHEGFTVDVVIVVPAPISIVWEVITDYQHMAEFIPNLTESQVLERNQRGTRVQQKGYTRFGPFRLDFESTRDIQITAEYELRAHGVAGNMQRVESLTRLKAADQGTRLEYHVEAQPSFWVPPLIGPLVVRDQVAEQFSALVGEMLRRR